MAQHEFWGTQPVLQQEGDALAGGDIPQEIMTVDPTQYPDTPLPLPERFVWTSIDPGSEDDITELYNLLYSYYVEDDAHMFRFAYSKDILKWWLTSPGCKSEYSIGIRLVQEGAEDHNKLIGYISGVVSAFSYSDRCHSESGSEGPNTSRVFSRPMQSIVFLCLHKKYRALKLAPLLIQEITRRSYKNGVFQAIYTSGISLSAPVQVATYFHRILNPMKLARIGFCQKPKTISDREFNFHYKLPVLPSIIGSRCRSCTETDIPTLYEIYTEYSKKMYKFRHDYSLDLFTHVVTHRKDTMHTVVYAENESNGPDAFISYYIINTAVLSKDVRKQYPIMRNGYIYIYALREGCGISLSQLVLIAMHDMQKSEVDVCTALNIGANASIFTAQKFSEGSGKLNYYMYNLKWPKMELSDIGVVLI